VGTGKSSFSVGRLLELFDSELSTDESIALNFALQSLAKRLQYCEHHYQEYLAYSTPSKLIRERFGTSCNSIRIQYEANFLALLNNLHCIVDAIPYALNIMYRKTKTKGIEHKSVSWHSDHIKLYSEEKIYSAISELINCKTFEVLKELSNRSKHKHLIPISNCGNSLTIESFSYSVNGQPAVIIPTANANDFVSKCHEILVPLVINIFNEEILIQEAKKAKYDHKSS
jgi:hypothetical protein